MAGRGSLRIGIPRVLNMYTYAPFFNAYFEKAMALIAETFHIDPLKIGDAA